MAWVCPSCQACAWNGRLLALPDELGDLRTGARYYTPASVVAAILADPVVTSCADRLRFESFSGCCGVHARLDLLPAALEEAPVASGTTNVDFNEPMRAALAGVAAGGPLLLSVGADEVRVTTADATVTERKVPLPGRWLKGFGEVQALAAERVIAALTYLAARGRVGYDLAEESFFHRELPFGPALEAMHPRLADARALVASGSVVSGQRGALVRSGGTEHRVTFASPHDICTCPWWGKHRGTRGPCKHVLAVRMAARS